MKVSWHVAGYGVMGLFLVSAVFAYEGAKRDKDRSDSVQSAQAMVQKQLTQTISDLQRQMAERESAYQADKKAMQARLSQAATPQQLASLVTQLMGLKTPIQITTPMPTSANPTPQPVAQVSLADSPEIKNYVNQCEACKIDLPKLQADLMDRNKQMALAQKQIESLTIQRDAAVKATKGGSWIRRAVHNGKVAAIGGAAALAIACGTGHCPK